MILSICGFCCASHAGTAHLQNKKQIVEITHFSLVFVTMFSSPIPWVGSILFALLRPLPYHKSKSYVRKVEYVKVLHHQLDAQKRSQDVLFCIEAAPCRDVRIWMGRCDSIYFYQQRTPSNADFHAKPALHRAMASNLEATNSCKGA